MTTLGLPPTVTLGMEFRRRGLTPPPEIDALTGEFERRGLLGQTTQDDPEDLTSQREQWVSGRLEARLGELTRLEAQRQAVLALPDDTDAHTIQATLGTVEPSYAQRTALYQSLPEGWMDQERAKLAQEFDRDPKTAQASTPQDRSARTPLAAGQGWMRDFSNASVRSVMTDIPAAVQELFGLSDVADQTRKYGELRRPVQDTVAAQAGGLVGSLGLSALALVQPELWPVVLGHASLMGAGGMGRRISDYERETGKQVTPALAAALMTGAGFTAYAVEKLQIRGLEHIQASSMAKAGELILAGNLGAGAKFLAKAMAAGGATEAAEEVIEGRINNLLDATYRPDKRSVAAVMEGTISDAIGGFAGGALLGGPAVLGATARARAGLAGAAGAPAKVDTQTPQTPAPAAPAESPTPEVTPTAAPTAPVEDPTGARPADPWPASLESPEAVAGWYARTYGDLAGEGGIRAMTDAAPGPYDLVQVPLDQIQDNTLMAGDMDQAKVDDLVRLGPAELGRLAPIIAVPDASGAMIVADGAHRLAAARSLGLATIPAYLPRVAAESMARSGVAVAPSVVGSPPGPAQTPAADVGVHGTGDAGGVVLPGQAGPGLAPTETPASGPAAQRGTGRVAPGGAGVPAPVQPGAPGQGPSPVTPPSAATPPATPISPADYVAQATVVPESPGVYTVRLPDGRSATVKAVSQNHAVAQASKELSGQHINAALVKRIITARIKQALRPKPQKGASNAPQEGQQPANRQREYPQAPGRGVQAQAGRGDRAVQGGQGQAEEVAPSPQNQATVGGEPVVTRHPQIAGEVFSHYTTAVSASALQAGQAFNSEGRPAVHLLEGSDTAQRWGGNRLYLAMPGSRWGYKLAPDESIPEIPVPKGYQPQPNDAFRYDYENQRDMVRPGALRRQDLVPVNFRIKTDASIVTIGAATTKAGKRLGVGITPEQAMEMTETGYENASEMFDALQGQGYDVVAVLNADAFGNREAGVAGWRFYEGATGDQLVVLNPDAVEMIPSPKAQAPSAAAATPGEPNNGQEVQGQGPQEGQVEEPGQAEGQRTEPTATGEPAPAPPAASEPPAAPEQEYEDTDARPLVWARHVAEEIPELRMTLSAMSRSGDPVTDAMIRKVAIKALTPVGDVKTPEGIWIHWRGGYVWVNKTPAENAPDLSGKSLIDALRAAYAIPAPPTAESRSLAEKEAQLREKAHTMTRAEYVAASRKLSPRGPASPTLRVEHRNLVEEAIKAGKDVPPNVVAEYPELATVAFAKEYDLRRRDSLTGLYNRLGAETEFTAMMAKSDAAQKPIALFSIDLILFKQINDMLGYDLGDIALENTAAAINSAIRSAPGRQTDNLFIASRRGGDEFEVALYDVTPAQAEMVGKRMQEAYLKAMDAAGVKLPAPLQTGLGFGFALREPMDTDVDALRKRANVDLLERKHAYKAELNLPTREEAERIVEDAKRNPAATPTLQLTPEQQAAYDATQAGRRDSSDISLLGFRTIKDPDVQRSVARDIVKNRVSVVGSKNKPVVSRELFDAALAVLEDAPVSRVEVPGGQVLFYESETPEDEMGPRERAEAKKRQTAREKIVKGLNDLKPPPRAPAPARKGKGKAKHTPPRVRPILDRVGLLKAMLGLATEVRGMSPVARIAKVGEGSRLTVFSDTHAAWVTDGAASWGTTGDHAIEGGQLITGEAVEDQSNALTSADEILAKVIKQAKPLNPSSITEIDTAVRHIRQALIMQGRDTIGDVYLNSDQTLGYHTADFDVNGGEAEINIRQGAELIGHMDLRNWLDVMTGAGQVGGTYAMFGLTDTAPSGQVRYLTVRTNNAGRTFEGVMAMTPPEQGKGVAGKDGEEEAEGDQTTEAMAARRGTPPGVSRVPGGPAVPAAPASAGGVPGMPGNTGRYTNDWNPLDAAEGTFRRTGADRMAKITAGTAEARARRDGAESKSAGDDLYRIVSDVARRFNLGAPGYGRARVLRTKALAFFQTPTQGIRMRGAGMAGAFFHEVGHYLHQTLFPRTKKGTWFAIHRNDFPASWRKPLYDLGKQQFGTSYPDASMTKEGWAEFVRMLFTSPKAIKARGPEMDRLYGEVVRTLVTHHPEVWATIENARVRLTNAVQLAAEDPVDPYVAHDDTAHPWNMTSLRDWFRSRLFDRVTRLATMTKDLGLSLLDNTNPHTLALRVNGKIAGDSKIMTDHGTFDPADPTRQPTGKGLTAILTPIKDQLRTWQNYMVARRALEKRGQGFDKVLMADPTLPNMTSDLRLRDFIQRCEQKYPAFKTAATEFQAFNRWLVTEYAVHYHLLTPEAAQLIVERNLEYITFRHKFTEDALLKAQGAKSARGGFAGMGSGFRRFRQGMGEPLFPPLDSFFASMQGIVSNARLNEVARSIVFQGAKPMPGHPSADPLLAMGSARWFQTIDRPMEANKVGDEALQDEVRRQLGIKVRGDQYILPPSMQGMSQDQVDAVIDAVEQIQGATFWKPGSKVDGRNREFTVLDQGKPKFFEAKDYALYQALAGMGNPYTSHLILKIVSIPRRVITAGATQYNPSFFVPNMLRDTTQALVMTETDLSKLPEQARERLRGIRQAFVGGDLERLFLASGADMSDLFGEYYDPRKQKVDWRGMFGKPRYLKLIKGGNAVEIAKDLATLGPVDRLNRSFEMMTRLGEFAVFYQQARAAGMSESAALASAGQAAADITLDFQAGGTWSKEVNQVVPFFNAAMLGVDKLGRFISRDPLKALGRIFTMLVVPSLIQLLMNLRNEDYWARPLSERDRNWLIPYGYDDAGRPSYLRIPKPYGLGIFSIATERTFARLFGIDPETGQAGGDQRAFKDVGQALLNELRPTLNIAGLQPLLEVMAGDLGWSFYRDATIVPQADRNLLPGEQGADRSSDLARILGGFMGYPPAKIDYMIQGWFGGLGKDAVQVLADPVLRQIDPNAKKGEPIEFSDWLVVRRFLAGHTRGGHEAMTRFYDDWEHLQHVHASLKRREDDPEGYAAFQERHADELDLYASYSQSQQRMSASFSELRALYRQRSAMDPDTLNTEIDRLYTSIIDEARLSLQARREQASPRNPQE